MEIKLNAWGALGLALLVLVIGFVFFPAETEGAINGALGLIPTEVSL